MSDEHDDFEGDDYDGRPSKSERKRNAHEAQALGEELIRLKELDLKAFALPEPLFDAIVEARRLTSRTAMVRAAAVHREADAGGGPGAHSRGAGGPGEKASQEAARFKKVEHWRNRLITER